MKNYLIDSDILIYFLKGSSEVVTKINSIASDNLFISRINYTELMYGAYNSSKIIKNLAVIEPFLESFKLLEFDKESSLIFAKEKSRLKQKGSLIADMDLMIASIALKNNCSLVTNNTKHFDRIKNLKISNPKSEK